MSNLRESESQQHLNESQPFGSGATAVVDEDALEGVIEVPMGLIDPRLAPGEPRAA